MTIPFYRKAQNGNETGLLPFFFNKILLDLYYVIKGTELEESYKPEKAINLTLTDHPVILKIKI